MITYHCSECGTQVESEGLDEGEVMACQYHPGAVIDSIVSSPRPVEMCACGRQTVSNHDLGRPACELCLAVEEAVPTPRKLGRPVGTCLAAEERARRSAQREADGAAFRALRKAAGLTQQQVADAAGVTRAAVGLWESGLVGVPERGRAALRTAWDSAAKKSTEA